MMKVNDYIYGEFEVDQVLIELINTKEVQRLKDIHQGGASYLVNKKWNTKRYDHSIGTMLLVKMMGGCVKEQIAALLHDISHTAFSHVIDFALDYKDEDYHEQIFESVIENSEIPKILEKHGMDYREILFDESKWTILEKSAPKLCGDRVDYTLRDMYVHGNAEFVDIKSFLENIKTIDGEIVVTDLKCAEWFVDCYYKEVIDFFMHPLNIYAYEKLANLLRLALNKNILSLDDLMLTDEEVLTIIKSSKNEELLEILASINEDVKLEENKIDYDIYQKRKLRTIDPGLLFDGKVIKTSDKSSKAKELTAKAVEKTNEGIYIKILK